MAYETIEELAGKLNLSPSTISRVINGKNNVSEKTRKKVTEALASSKYVPNMIARGLKTSTNFIGIIFPDIRNPYFTEVILGIESVLKKRGYTIVHLNTNNNLEEEEKAIIQLLSVRVKGIILLSNLSNRNSEILEMAKENAYLTSVENYIEGIDNICVDNEYGTRLAMEYLYSRGHKKIGYCSKNLNYSSWNIRYKIYKDFLSEKDLKYYPEYVYIGDDFSKFFEKKNLPSAIFTNNDVNAIEVYEWCQKNGIRVPEDLSIIGFDNISFSKILSPKLTTIAQPAYEIGATVAENLLLRIEKENKESVKKIFIEPTLQSRDSVQEIRSES